MEFITETILDLFLLFFVYSFLGWFLESIYRSIYYKKWTNSGFFNGPVLPIFGVSSILVIQIWEFTSHNILITFLLALLSINILEYIVSAFCEKFIGLRFWDYSKLKFNFKGRISLESSVVWAILLYLLLFLIHPFVLGQISAWGYYFKEILVAIFLLVFIIDFVFTILSLLHIRKIILEFDEEITHGQLKRNLKRLAWLLSAFPDLYLFIKKRLKKGFDK